MDATLVIRQGDGAGGEFPINGELVLGREQGSADLVLDDPGISRRHAAVRADAGGISVEDLGSSNGTFVNGRRIRGEVVLADGDEVQVGGTVLSVHRGAAATAIAPQQPRAIPDASPGRLAPDPHAEGNIPALAAAFCGPLSIFLLLFGGGAAFFVSLPLAIGAIVLGTIGRRRAEAGQGQGTLARIGRITGIVGAILSIFAIAAFIVASIVLDVTEDSLDGILESIRDEIEGVQVPDGVDVPEAN